MLIIKPQNIFSGNFINIDEIMAPGPGISDYLRQGITDEIKNNSVSV